MPDRHEQRLSIAKAAGVLPGGESVKKPGRFPLEGGTAITLPPRMDSKPTVSNTQEEGLRARMAELTKKIEGDPDDQSAVAEYHRLRELLRDIETNRNNG